MEKSIIDFLLKYRYALSLLCIILTVILSLGANKLYFNSDYQIFFSKDDPQKLAHDEQQHHYTKTDTLSILIQPKNKTIFTQRNLEIIQTATELGWQTPYSLRVDSITNFQYSRADGDDLIVEDLVKDSNSLSNTQIQKIKNIALSEKQLINRLISRDSSTTMIDISLELPPSSDLNSDKKTQEKQRRARDNSFIEVVEYGHQVRDKLLAKYPNLTIHLMGIPIINRSFDSSSQKDSTTLIPLMYVCIIILLALFLRSIGSMIGSVIVIATSIFAAIGGAGWVGYSINTVSVSAPIIILTIAVCDCVHILVIYLRNLSIGGPPLEAMRESLRINLQPILLTSVTTAVGFLTLNLSVSPPFGELGNIAAFGIIYAMLLSLCLLPCITLILVRSHKHGNRRDVIFEKFVNWLLNNRKTVFICVIAVTTACVSLIPRNQINDNSIQYFKKGVPFRDAAEFAQQTLPGIVNVNFSLDCKQENCVTNPAYLKKLKSFCMWLEQQPHVEKVITYADTIRRINRNMNRDDPTFYRIPDNANLAAQYHFVYELSLPQGLDLANQITFDKSATLVRVFLEHIGSGEITQFEENAAKWLTNNHPELATHGASIDMMFAMIGEKNIRSMLIGALIALFGVTLTIFIALRSAKYALISLIPNAFPAAIAFGLWGILIAEINVAVAAVFSITLGIVVDDTVHFITKYRYAREQKQLSPEQAIHYAFANVGNALLITSVVLALGFGVLALSDFNLNAYIGILTGMTVIIALIFDYLILPLLLLAIDKNTIGVKKQGAENH